MKIVSEVIRKKTKDLRINLSIDNFRTHIDFKLWLTLYYSAFKIIKVHCYNFHSLHFKGKIVLRHRVIYIESTNNICKIYARVIKQSACCVLHNIENYTMCSSLPHKIWNGWKVFCTRWFKRLWKGKLKFWISCKKRLI